jgi:DNA repair protein RecO (recombination protein O)
MLDKTEGIVLKTTKYSESSVITSIFTKKYGLLSFIVQGIRSSKKQAKRKYDSAIEFAEYGNLPERTAQPESH